MGERLFLLLLLLLYAQIPEGREQEEQSSLLLEILRAEAGFLGKNVCTTRDNVRDFFKEVVNKKKRLFLRMKRGR